MTSVRSGLDKKRRRGTSAVLVWLVMLVDASPTSSLLSAAARMNRVLTEYPLLSSLFLLSSPSRFAACLLRFLSLWKVRTKERSVVCACCCLHFKLAKRRL